LNSAAYVWPGGISLPAFLLRDLIDPLIDPRVALRNRRRARFMPNSTALETAAAAAPCPA
jgi:hypothetical protein